MHERILERLLWDVYHEARDALSTFPDARVCVRSRESENLRAVLVYVVAEHPDGHGRDHTVLAESQVAYYNLVSGHVPDRLAAAMALRLRAELCAAMRRPQGHYTLSGRAA